MRGLDCFGAGRVLGSKSQIIQSQAGFSGKQCRKHSKLFCMRCHGLLGELSQLRNIAVLVSADIQEAGHAGLPFIHLLCFIGHSEHVLLRERIEFRDISDRFTVRSADPMMDIQVRLILE